MSKYAGNFQGLPIFPTIASLPVLPSTENGSHAFCDEVGRPIYSFEGEWFRLDGTAVLNPALGLMASSSPVAINGTTPIPILTSSYTGPITTTPVYLKLNIGFQSAVYAGNNRQLVFPITIGGVLRTINVINMDTATSPALFVGTVQANIKLYENASAQTVVDMDAVAFLSDAELINTTNITLSNRDGSHPHFQSALDEVVTNNPVDISVSCRFNVTNTSVNAQVSPILFRVA